MAYEELKREYNKYRKKASDAQLNPLEYIAMAAFSKNICSCYDLPIPGGPCSLAGPAQQVQRGHRRD
uniref:Uncharacterized protein n=1 Tax=Anguilla anguilla TaxID=7936 RepID=A0A0E9PJH8_ANGAN